MADDEPEFPGLRPVGTGETAGKRIKLADIEAMSAQSTVTLEVALEKARVEASLPSLMWDRALVLEDIVSHTLADPRRELGCQYRYLRDYFLEDTGTTDLVPDFVRGSEDLPSVWRYLDRMGVSPEEQIEHVKQAFKELADFMELVFRPRHINYQREPWPGKPIPTPFAAAKPTTEAIAINSADWTGRYDPILQAKRVLSIAPLAIKAIEQLIQAAEQARRNNAPPEGLEPAALEHLRALHSELGALIAAARRGADLRNQLASVKAAFGKAFTMLRNTGELVVADVPPLAAAMVPCWATYGLCKTLFDLTDGSSATIAGGALAASGALQAARFMGTNKPDSSGAENTPDNT